MRLQTMWYVRPLKPQISLHAQSEQSLCLLLEYFMMVKLLTVHNMEFPSLKGVCTGLSESTLVKMPHFRKFHATAHIFILRTTYPTLNFCDLLHEG